MSANIKVDELAPMVAELRSNWWKGVTRPASFRRQQLLQMRKMITEHFEEASAESTFTACRGRRFLEFIDVANAEIKDFRKDFMARSEVTAIVAAIDETLEDFETQMKPRSAEIIVPSLGGSAQVVPEPYGVVAVFSAWNYPLHLLLGPAAGAIAAGNCVVLKPSEIAVNCSDLYQQLVPKYLDQRCFRVVCGPVQMASALLELKWDFICFTGSTNVGKLVYQSAAKHLTPVLLELGGKSPVYVHRDADLEQAANRITWGKFMNCGQTCVAPDYLLVDEAVKQKFLDILVKRIKQFYGDDASKSKDYEQVISERHVARLAGLLKGQRVLYGGRVIESQRFIEPTIVDDPDPESPLMQEEIFGPILPVITVKTPEEAIRFINMRPKPLSLYLFTLSKALQQQFVAETTCGGLTVNDVFMHTITPSLPFGGVGDSGVGAYHGKHTFETFSHLKPVLYSPTLSDPGFRYPPYTPQALKLSNFFMFYLSMKKIKQVLGSMGVVVFAIVAYFFAQRFFK